MQALLELLEHGQSYWLDNLTRGMLRSGELERRVREQGLRGVTSNPAIFHKAISSGTDYDEQIRALATAGASVEETYESLVVTDIREACDVLRPVYDGSGGVDGYVSLEVSPHLVHDTAGSLAEARHLWSAVDRPNLMIKIPGTEAGVPAIEELLFDGINVNVTLLFSIDAYEQVARAYMRALARRAGEGRSLDTVASVASFFLSRIDVLVDGLLAHHVGPATGPAAAQQLYGLAAVASARLAYRRYLDLSASPEWASLGAAGARPQRLLWASTSTKNPLYDPVRYVEPLVGRDTVNTMPEVTIEAFAASGRVVPDAIERDVDAAERVFADLAAVGIDMEAVNEQLLAEGAKKFIDPFDSLLTGLAARLGEVRPGPRVETREPAGRVGAFDSTLAALREQRFARRLWARDPSLWPGTEAVRESIAGRLGWTRGSAAAVDLLPELESFAAEVRADGLRDVVLLGMGGSSLCPLVAAHSLPPGEGSPRVHVLDSVDPAAVSRVDAAIDLARTLFVVASKSGSTVETMSLYAYFRQRLEEQEVPGGGRHFVAVTDPDSPLVSEAQSGGFRRVFEAPPDVGGRYSALTAFGLLPMALMGADLDRVIEWARTLEQVCPPALPESANPAVRLGASLALLARAGRDKLTLTASEGLSTLPMWIEQLVAESTGKEGRGIVPVTGDPVPAPGSCGSDRVFVHYALADEATAFGPGALDALEEAGHPVFRFTLPEAEALGSEFLRWEIATAVAGAVLRVNPFDEPDVSAAKRATADLLHRWSEEGSFPAQRAQASRDGLDLFLPGSESSDDGDVADVVGAWLGSPAEAGYVAVLGYFDSSPERRTAISRLRDRLAARTGLATTFGYGPRYLHSTGQLHKGGSAGGLFLVLTADPVEDLPVPGAGYSFGTLQRAQALGDVETLRDRGRRVLHAHLGWRVEEGLGVLTEAVGG